VTAQEMARKFAEIAATAEAKQLIGETVVGRVVEASVKRTYGDASKLRALEQSTQDERESLGYNPNDPLKRTGDLLEESIHTARAPGLVEVGSSEPVAEYQELGFFNVRAGRFIEPRPAIAIGAADAQPEVARTVMATVKAIATGDDRQLLELAAASAVIS